MVRCVKQGYRFLKDNMSCFDPNAQDTLTPGLVAFAWGCRLPPATLRSVLYRRFLVSSAIGWFFFGLWFNPAGDYDAGNRTLH